MRRSLSCLAAVVLLASGCTGSDKGGDDEKLTGSIRVQVPAGEHEVKAAKRLAAAFAKGHPGTKVKILASADDGDHEAALSAALDGRSPPDVFLIGSSGLAPLAARGLIEPVGDGLGPLAADDFFSQATSAFTHRGKLLCVPRSASSVVVYVNPQLFRTAAVPLPKPGWTVADLTRTVAALVSKEIRDPIGFEPSLRTLAPFAWSAGGDIVDDATTPTHVSLGSAPARGALELLLALQGDGEGRRVRPPADAAARFAQGELAMLVDSRRAVPALRKAELDFDVVPLPVDAEPATLLVADAYCVTKAGKNKPLARAFARYAAGTEGGALLARTGLTVPALEPLATGPGFLDPKRAPVSSKVWLDALPTSRVMPTAARWAEAERVASAVLEEVFAGTISVDSAIERIRTDTARALSTKP